MRNRVMVLQYQVLPVREFITHYVSDLQGASYQLAIVYV